MRISKPPEERRQEIIDTAMVIFAEKGYESTTVSDIAKRMKVVSGLFYKYFSSKEELYHIALEQYAKQFSDPVVEAVKSEYHSVKEVRDRISCLLSTKRTDQRYHKFFHGRGNELFHQQLNFVIASQIIPHVAVILEDMKQKYKLNISNTYSTARFFVTGITTISDDDSLNDDEKLEIIMELFDKVIC